MKMQFQFSLKKISFNLDHYHVDLNCFSKGSVSPGVYAGPLEYRIFQTNEEIKDKYLMWYAPQTGFKYIIFIQNAITPPIEILRVQIKHP